MSRAKRADEGRGIRLDANGNIDTTHLEKELRSALEFDVAYKQKDNMKKRACKVAGDYGEFKAMVACAHLKKLSSKEVQSLGASKKGWQKNHVASGTEVAILLQEEKSSEGGGASTEHVGGVFSKLEKMISQVAVEKPKSSMILERDLRRLQGQEQKIEYLSAVGLKRIKTLLKTDGGPDLMEQILSAVMFSESLHAAAALPTLRAAETAKEEVAPESIAEGDGDVEASSPAGHVSVPSSSNSLNTFKWLKAISTCERFDLTIRFAAPELVASICAYLEGCGCEDSEDVLSKYIRK